jgi:hypothetical protein
MGRQLAGGVADRCAAATAHRRGDEDYEIAQGLATTVPGAELFVYPGTEHYFAEHDEQAAALLKQRVLALLDQ